MFCLPGDIIENYSEKQCCGENTYERDGKILSYVAGTVASKTIEDTVYVSVEPLKNQGAVPTMHAVVLAKVASISSKHVWCEIVSVNDRPVSGPFRGLLRREDIRPTQKDSTEPSNCFRPGDLIRARIINLLGRGLLHVGGDSQSNAQQVDSNILVMAKAKAGSVKMNSGLNPRTANSTCLLSTAEPELGVVLGIGRDKFSSAIGLHGATSGAPLIPCSWTEMVCPNTLKRFPKKVAKVPDDYIAALL